MSQIKITVKCGRCQQTIWTLISPEVAIIEEKYPFWCEHCEEYARGFTWPWKLIAEVVE